MVRQGIPCLPGLRVFVVLTPSFYSSSIKTPPLLREKEDKIEKRRKRRPPRGIRVGNLLSGSKQIEDLLRPGHQAPPLGN